MPCRYAIPGLLFLLLVLPACAPQSPATSELQPNTAFNLAQKPQGKFPQSVPYSKDVDPETEMWEIVKDSKFLSDFDTFLREYPNGKFSKHASLRRDQLRRNKNSSKLKQSTKKVLASTASDATPPPPAPPIFETFDSEPQLSLFPRIGESRPVNEKIDYWQKHIDAFLETSGFAQGKGVNGSNGWTLRGSKSFVSSGFFSPLSVERKTNYRLSFDSKADLQEGGQVRVVVLEFREFQWIGEQYSQNQLDNNLIKSRSGFIVKGKHNWERHNFDFTTTSNTGMIHVSLLFEGKQNTGRAFFDNIRIEKQ